MRISRQVLTNHAKGACEAIGLDFGDHYEKGADDRYHAVIGRGHKELSAWDRLLIETTVRWSSAADTAREHFRVDCLTCKEGFYYGEDIPF